MRALLVSVILALPAIAHADSVLVMSSADSANELDAAMRVMLAGRGVSVTAMPLPNGELRLERAAAAQRAAADTGAQAAVWIDAGEVCAVTADGHDFRHAPFPREAASPRAFAAIATSLVDEMIAPGPGFDVDVNVSVTPHGAETAAHGHVAPRVAFAGPPSDAAPIAVDAGAPRPRAHADRTLLEIGTIISPLSYGIEANVAFPLTPIWRIAAMGSVNWTFDNRQIVGEGALELRHVGVGSTHWDVGPMLGTIFPDSENIAVFLGARLARTWELGRSALSLSASPVVIANPSSHSASSPVFPGAWASLRWQFAL